MFQGKNLANLRLLNGLSRKQLAEILEVTEQTVWQYENNFISPKLETINHLRAYFNVKTKYFYSVDVLKRNQATENINMMHIAYRSKVLHAISKTRAEAKHLEYLDQLVDELTRDLTYPTRGIIELRNKVVRYLNETDDLRKTQIENVAKMARDWLGSNEEMNDNILLLVEKGGVFIFEKAIGHEMDAYSLWTEQDRPYIILGNLKGSAVRRNFDIAHELGHLLLHYRVEFATLDRKDHTEIEKEANTFAGAFLLPQDAFISDMKTVKRVTNPDHYVDLKEKWHVSLQVLGYRAAQLGIIEPKQHRNFYAALHRRGYLQEEPLDRVIKIEKPMKIKSMFHFVCTNQLMDIRHLLENEWKVELTFLSKLTGVSPSFFEKYIIKDDEFSYANKVTELSAYQQ